MVSIKFSNFIKKPLESKEKNEMNLPKIKELTLEEESILEKNLVWIFASPRSGTQWLGTQLLEYNTIICHGPSVGLNLSSIHTGFENKIVRQIEYRGDEPDFCFSKKYKNVWQYFLRKFILNRIDGQFQNLTKKIVMPDPEGSLAADIISPCTPNSKVIVLLRDGRDIVDSVIDAAKEGSWHIKSKGLTPLKPNQRKFRIKRTSLRWVRQVEILLEVLENRTANLGMKVMYEDLRKNTLAELEKIYKFIGVDISQEQLQKIIDKYNFKKISDENKGSGKVTRSASPGKWKENFSEEEKQLMDELMGPTLKRLGY